MHCTAAENLLAFSEKLSNKESLLSTRWVSVLRAGHPEDLLNQEAVMAVKMKKFWETAELVLFIPDFEERAMKFLTERPASSVAALKAQVAGSPQNWLSPRLRPGASLAPDAPGRVPRVGTRLQEVP